jgi:hypothetical protein
MQSCPRIGPAHCRKIALSPFTVEPDAFMMTSAGAFHEIVQSMQP